MAAYGAEIGGGMTEVSSPTEAGHSYFQYSAYGYPWPQSDVRSMPQSNYSPATEPRYPQVARERLSSATFAFNA